jgi:hypothetical protein
MVKNGYAASQEQFASELQIAKADPVRSFVDFSQFCKSLAAETNTASG